MTIEKFIISMLELLTLGSAGQIRGCLNLIGGDMNPKKLSKILNDMVQGDILDVYHINNCKYYGLRQEYKEKIMK